MARSNWLLLLTLSMVGCTTARRPDLVLTNRFEHLDDGASSVGVDLSTYYATFVGEVGEGLAFTPVTDLAARVENEALCRARVREDGKVLEVWGLKEGDAVVGLRYARPGSLRPEHRRVRFHFFTLPPNPALAVGAPIPAFKSSGWDLPARAGRPALQCLKARGAPELKKWLGVEQREGLEIFVCRARREVQPGDWRAPQDCAGLCPDNDHIFVCAELREGSVAALGTFQPTGDEAAPYETLDREGAEGGPCTPAK